MFRNLLTTIASGALRNTRKTVAVSSGHRKGRGVFLLSGWLASAPFALLSAAVLSPVFAQAASNNQPKVLQPFTNEAHVPADTDVRTIRFEKVRAVLVPTGAKYTADSSYCTQLAFRDPGGSAFCPAVQKESLVAAYEVTYSFDGPASGDDSGLRRATFYVTLRPEELTAQARQAMAAGNQKRSKMAEYFTLSTYRENVRGLVADESKSSFCDGNFMDGNWKREDSGCVERISYTTVVRPSGSLTVRVNSPADVISAKR